MISIKSKFILSLLIFPLLSVTSSANLEQKLLSINEDNKQVTLTLFHFNTATQKASVLPVEKNIGSTIGKLSGKAAIAISQESGITVVDGKIVFSPVAKYLINAGTPVMDEARDTFSKHTFILSNGKGSFVLGYAPLSSKKELTYAIQQYVKSNKFNYHTAVLLNSGNNSAFFKENGDYHPYYLKELNAAKQMLMVK